MQALTDTFFIWKRRAAGPLGAGSFFWPLWHGLHRILRHKGLVILDNADWHHRCAEYLRAQGLIEVDMTGFGPINGYTWTTSFFLHREFAFQPRQSRQPWHGIGSLPHLEEEG